MREEIEALVENQGCTKNTVSKMYKVDSFLRESQRFDGMAVGESPSSSSFSLLKPYLEIQYLLEERYSKTSHSPTGLASQLAAR